VTDRRSLSSGSPWEDRVGYSRATRVGPLVELAGTVAADKNGVLHHGDAYAQSCYIIEKMHHYLLALGADYSNVVRTRMYLRHVDDWEEVTRAHAKYFSIVKPVSTLLVIKDLIDPEALVEIEMTAWVSE